MRNGAGSGRRNRQEKNRLKSRAACSGPAHKKKAKKSAFTAITEGSQRPSTGELAQKGCKLHLEGPDDAREKKLKNMKRGDSPQEKNLRKGHLPRQRLAHRSAGNEGKTFNTRTAEEKKAVQSTLFGGEGGDQSGRKGIKRRKIHFLSQKRAFRRKRSGQREQGVLALKRKVGKSTAIVNGT